MLPAMPLLMTPPSGGMHDPKQFVVFLAVYLGLIVIVLAPHYILNALGLYKIAARRGICHAWLAWVPLGEVWILGRISDQYQSLALQKQKKRGLILLLLQSTQCILYVLILVLFFDLYSCSETFMWTYHIRMQADTLFSLNVVVNLALCCILFARKKNNLLVITLGCKALVSLGYLIRYFAVINLLTFLANILLVVFALALCRQTLIKTDWRKVFALSQKIYYVPAVILLAGAICNWIDYWNVWYPAIRILKVTLNILNVGVLFFVAKWLCPKVNNTTASVEIPEEQ